MTAIVDDTITAFDLITQALKQRKCLATNETPTTDEAEDALQSLNGMLKTWSAQTASVYLRQLEAFPLQANVNSYTIGAGGVFDTQRPNRLAYGCFVRRSGYDYPLRVVDIADFHNQIGYKASPGIPSVISLEPSYPLAKIWLYYAPDRTDTLELASYQQLIRFANLTQVVNLPPEYYEPIIYNLARRLSSFGGSLGPEDLAIASEGLSTLKNINKQQIPIDTGMGSFGRHAAAARRGISNILTGGT